MLLRVLTAEKLKAYIKANKNVIAKLKEREQQILFPKKDGYDFIPPADEQNIGSVKFFSVLIGFDVFVDTKEIYNNNWSMDYLKALNRMDVNQTN